MPQPDLPAQIGRYPVSSLLARGGMGAVYLGRHPELGYEVAIKVLLAGRSASAEQLRRFRREVTALAKLEHPNLVQILDWGEEGGLPWFAMRRVEGHSLEERLRREGPLPVEEVVELGRQLGAALAKVHQLGVLHRDLKPDNVLCGTAGQFVITDFGLAKDTEVEESVRLSRTGLMQGTPRYWSPEQASGAGGSATEATDVYGLGATLYAALTGEPPIDGTTWVELIVATRDQAPTPPSRLRPQVPAWLEQVVLRCLEKEPYDRYRSASELLGDLERRTFSTANGLVAGRQTWRAVAVALAVLLPILLLLGVLFLGVWAWRFLDGPPQQPVERRGRLERERLARSPEPKPESPDPALVLAHVRVGQKYVFFLNNAGLDFSQVWEVTGITSRRVHYQVTTRAKGEPLGDPEDRTWRRRRPPPGGGLREETPLPVETLTLAGREWVCWRVETSGGHTSWMPTVGDLETFPPIIKSTLDDKITNVLVKIEEPTE